MHFVRAFWVRCQVLIETDLAGDSVGPRGFQQCLRQSCASITDEVAAGLQSPLVTPPRLMMRRMMTLRVQWLRPPCSYKLSVVAASMITWQRPLGKAHTASGSGMTGGATFYPPVDPDDDYLRFVEVGCTDEEARMLCQARVDPDVVAIGHATPSPSSRRLCITG
jgi:hypothetical protein